jgi:hypothetical protein
MRSLVWGAAAVALVVAAPATAGDITFKPIDTNKLVVKPSKAAADLSAATIKLVGNTTAGAVEQNGYVKTINNLFGFRKEQTMPIQAGRSPIPAPHLFPSTQYKSNIQPVMPSSQPVRRR